jgi:hypothetical protein
MKGLTRIFLTIVIGLAFCLVIYLLLVKPSLNRMTVLSKELLTKRVEAITLEQQIRAYKTAQSDLSKATEKDKIANLIPKREDLVQSVISMEEAVNITATEHDLKINDDRITSSKAPAPRTKEGTPQVLTSKPGLLEITYRLSSNNDFTNTVRLLKYLEHLPQFTEIYKINLSAQTTDSADGAVRTGNVLGTFDGIFVIKDDKAK